MRREDIVGLTLAEIALTLLFFFLAVFAPTYARLNRKLKAINLIDVARLQTELKAAEAENETLKAELEKYRPNLRSAAVPSCAEINKADWLFTTIIRGSDTYDIDGVSYSIGNILATYSKELSDARQNGCRHRIKVYYGAGVSLDEYDSALRKIEVYFYDLKLGPEPR